MITGKDLIVYEGNPAVAIAACRSFTILNKADLEERSSPDSGIARNYEVVRISWEISISTFVLSMKNYVLRRGQTYFITIKDRNNASDFISGSAICTNVEITAKKGSLVQGSLQFIGKDDMSPSAPEPIEIGPDFNDDYNEDYLIS